MCKKISCLACTLTEIKPLQQRIETTDLHLYKNINLSTIAFPLRNFQFRRGCGFSCIRYIYIFTLALFSHLDVGRKYSFCITFFLLFFIAHTVNKSINIIIIRYNVIINANESTLYMRKNKSYILFLKIQCNFALLYIKNIMARV